MLALTINLTTLTLTLSHTTLTVTLTHTTLTLTLTNTTLTLTITHSTLPSDFTDTTPSLIINYKFRPYKQVMGSSNPSIMKAEYICATQIISLN